MNCKHESIMCRNNVFLCLKCGAEVPSPYQTDKHPTETANASEGPKKAVKRTTRKKT
jgi:hypothetical protein